MNKNTRNKVRRAVLRLRAIHDTQRGLDAAAKAAASEILEHIPAGGRITAEGFHGTVAVNVVRIKGHTATINFPARRQAKLTPWK
jgi:hypothetical protein